MSFYPGLVSSTDDSVTPEASFLASQHIVSKRCGVTLDASAVGADANGDKILLGGTVLAKIDSTGLYRPYLNSEDADAGGTAEGFLFETINLKTGNATVGMMIHGSVLTERVSGLDADARTDLAGRIIFQEA